MMIGKMQLKEQFADEASRSSRQPTGREIITFALTHLLVFICAVICWNYWGIIIGFAANCVLDAMVLSVWIHEARLLVTERQS